MNIRSYFEVFNIRMITSLTADQTTQLAESFRLLGDGSRLRILMACLGGPRSVGDIARALSLSPSLVSHHLRLLRSARLVRGERRGKQVFYVAADQHIRCIVEDMAEHVCEAAPIAESA